MVTVYTTAPTSVDRDPAQFRRMLVDAARWTEETGGRGLLVYSDNALADPWATAQHIIAATERVVPLVAVQPVYMSPFTAARMVSTIGTLHGRALDINLVTGGFGGHLRALDCGLDHDERYRRVVEYGEIMRALLTADRPVSYTGQHYRLRAAGFHPPLPPDLMPRFFLSGSSPAAIAAQGELDMVRFAYPHAVTHYEPGTDLLHRSGVRIGIIARPDPAEAWALARQRFPLDPQGERQHDLASRVVESSWHRDLSKEAVASAEPQGSYWLYPFRAYKTFCPYLVGGYDEVAATLARYLELGVEAIVLDEPHSEPDLRHAMHAITLARQATRTMEVA